MALVPTDHPDLALVQEACLEAVEGAVGKDSVMSYGKGNQVAWPHLFGYEKPLYTLEGIGLKPDQTDAEDDFDALGEWLADNHETMAQAHVPWLMLGCSPSADRAYLMLWDGQERHHVRFLLNPDLPRNMHSLMLQWLDFDNMEPAACALKRCVEGLKALDRVEILDTTLPPAESSPTRGRGVRF